jgi:hypothetical protein
MVHRDSHWTVATGITDAMAKGDSRSSSPVNSGNERPAGVMPATVERTAGRGRGVASNAVPHGRIRCFRRNLKEQRLRRAQRCGEAVPNCAYS